MSAPATDVSGVVERTEILLPGPARALGSLLGVRVPDLEGGAGLPLMWHWVYLLDRPGQDDLGPDGHPVRGTVAAFPGGGRRRVWAGGRVRTFGALRCGEPATKHSRVRSVQDKRGRSGPLKLIVVEHRILQNGRLVVEEQQDVIYREASAPAAAPVVAGPAVPPADGEWAIEVSPTLLFRFSALTYNAHRIHYDRDYARDVEGYPGLLVQGTLQAVAMAEAARAAGHPGGPAGDRLRFDYRLVAPLLDHEGLIVGVEREADDRLATAVRDERGRRTAIGTLGVEDAL